MRLQTRQPTHRRGELGGARRSRPARGFVTPRVCHSDAEAQNVVRNSGTALQVLAATTARFSSFRSSLASYRSPSLSHTSSRMCQTAGMKGLLPLFSSQRLLFQTPLKSLLL